MKLKKWWIKERYNPQLGTYWVPMGQMSETQARRHEAPTYGDNTMHPFGTEAEYNAKIAELRLSNQRIHQGI
jgi:hypothetical protein